MFFAFCRPVAEVRIHALRRIPVLYRGDLLLTLGEATIDHQFGTGYIARLVGGQP